MWAGEEKTVSDLSLPGSEFQLEGGAVGRTKADRGGFESQESLGPVLDSEVGLPLMPICRPLPPTFLL
ncbi:hypothetical protein Cadr_000024747 [Camelus dromedarius]|uniref:Uncharacterized protein n=1 Tax=Camelus dromedarius TaxID=9838 RepID=A0A5N4CP36_CAMDR|nr:hypothetical protein Cadr_000024747 [Camelus dromedarius]